MLAKPPPAGLVRRVIDAIVGPQKHADRWKNYVTGAGTHDRDKSVHTFMAPLRRLMWNELESIYYGDWCSAKLVNARPNEYFRTGFELEGEGADTLKQNFKTLGIATKLQDATIWARLWGGAGLVCAVDDGQTVDMPVNLDRARGLKFVNVVDLRYLQPVTYYEDPTEDNFGTPRTFMVTPAFGETITGNGVMIHESRIIRFQGTKVDPITQRRLGGWSYSALQRPYDVLRRIGQTFQAASQLMYDAGQAVIKMSDLVEQLSSNQAATLARIAQADMARWSGKIVAVDRDKEEFERVATPLAGVPDLFDRIILELSGACDAPLTRIFGRSPAGQNATGESDDRMWYESVESDRINIIDPAIERLCLFMTRGKWEGKTAWGGLQQPDDLKDAQIEKTRAERWNIFVDMGAVSGEQVALIELLKRPIEEVLDEDALERMATLETEMAEETAKNPPPPPAPPLATGAPIPTGSVVSKAAAAAPPER